jgi:hypothetical protein
MHQAWCKGTRETQETRTREADVSDQLRAVRADIRTHSESERPPAESAYLATTKGDTSALYSRSFVARADIPSP